MVSLAKRESSLSPSKVLVVVVENKRVVVLAAAVEENTKREELKNAYPSFFFGWVRYRALVLNGLLNSVGGVR